MLSWLDSLLYFVGTRLPLAATDLICDWENPVMLPEDEEACALLLTDGSLVSFIEISGVRRFIGTQDFENLASNLGVIIGSRLSSGNQRGHSLSFCFRSDPQGSLRIASELTSGMIATARRLGMTDVSFFEHRRDRIAQVCTDESVYLAVYSHRAGMTPNELKTAAERNKHVAQKVRAQGAILPPSNPAYSQTLRQPSSLLINRHKSMVTNLVSDLQLEISAKGTYLLARLLTIHRASNLVRRVFDHSPFPETWQARLIGDKGFTAASLIERSTDQAAMLPPRLAHQMIPGSIQEFFSPMEHTRMGLSYSASIAVEVLPMEGSEPFNRLMARIGRSMPIAFRFDILPDGFSYNKLTQNMGSFMAAMGDANKSIKRGWNELRRMQADGQYIAATRMVFTTWSSSPERLHEQLEMLRSSVESWGSAVGTNEFGSPGQLAVATASGMTNSVPVPVLPAPVDELARMAPVVRAASLWERGQMICSTLDGRAYPIYIGSGLQNSWGIAGFAPTGAGKSFWLNLLNSGLLLTPGAQEVPLICVVDVGPSSRLVMDYYRTLLPPHKRSQVVSIRIRNSLEFAVNPFDTFYGLDCCTEEDNDFLTAFLATVSPGLGDESDKFFSQVIQAAYAKFSRDSPDAKVWQDSLDAEVRQAIHKIGYKIEEAKTRVWDVVDVLATAGLHDTAERAQRYAMPILKDLSAIVAQADISLMWGTALAANGRETMITVFQRNVASATTLNYQLLSNYTQANLGAARAISIDLEEVVGSMTSEEGQRRSALMFMLGRRLGARKFFARYETIEKICPPAYRAYHKHHMQKTWEQLKFLQYDETHYASAAVAFRRLISRDLRVGRKFNLVTAMFSQLLQDFSEDVIANASTFIIFGVGDGTGVADMSRVFQLTEAEKDAVVQYCTKPGTFFARFLTREGRLTQVLKTIVNPFEMWAFTTNATDAPVRDQMTNMLGGDLYEAIRVLALLLPEGSSKNMSDSIKAAMNEDTVSEESVAFTVSERLLERARREKILR